MIRRFSLSSTLLACATLMSGLAFADDPPASRPAEKGDAQKTEPKEAAPPKTEPKPATPEAEPKKKGKKGKRGPGWLGDLDLAALQISEADRAKLRDVLAASKKTYRERLEEVRGDKKATRGLRKELRKSTLAKFREVLGKDGFAKVREQLGARRKKGKGAKKGKGKKGKGGKKNAAQSSEQILKPLALSAEESAVIKPILDGLLETKKLLSGEQAKRQARYRAEIEKTTDEAKLGDLLKQLRKERAEDAQTLAKARERLREVLEVRHEARLVGMGVLD